MACLQISQRLLQIVFGGELYQAFHVVAVGVDKRLAQPVGNAEQLEPMFVTITTGQRHGHNTTQQAGPESPQ